jgi:hypothetical protein
MNFKLICPTSPGQQLPHQDDITCSSAEKKAVPPSALSAAASRAQRAMASSSAAARASHKGRPDCTTGSGGVDAKEGQPTEK